MRDLQVQDAGTCLLSDKELLDSLEFPSQLKRQVSCPLLLSPLSSHVPAYWCLSILAVVVVVAAAFSAWIYSENSRASSRLDSFSLPVADCGARDKCAVGADCGDCSCHSCVPVLIAGR